MNKLKQYIFEYLRKRMPEREARFPHLDQPLKVMIIYESDFLERNDAIKSIRQDLLRRHLDVSMWGYIEKKDIKTLILPQSRILGVDDYSWYGKPKDFVLKDLQTEHYDLLIDLTTHTMLPLRYLTMYAEADFKVGLNLGEGVHDMLISLPDLAPEDGEQVSIEAGWLFQNIMSYLTTIKSMD